MVVHSCTFEPQHRHPPILVENFRSYNAPPSGPELAEILRVIQEEKNDVETYTKELSRLRKMVEDLVKRRATLQDKIRRRLSFISVLRRIPEEVLAEIFGRCVVVDHAAIVRARSNNPRGGDEKDLKDLKDAFHAPFRLSHVCSRWRAIMLNAPEVWTSICINLYAPNPVGILQLYLERSRDRQPVDTVVWDHGITRPRDFEIHYQRLDEGARAFQMLMTSSNMTRFRSLTILNDGCNLNDVLPPMDPPSNIFPRMEYLHISSKPGLNSYPFWLWEGFRQAPRLGNAHVGAGIGFEMIMNANIRSLDIESAGFHFLLDLVPHLHRLERLTLREAQLVVEIPIIPPIRFQTLRDLKMVCGDRRSADQSLLLSLDFPALRSLELHIRYPVYSFAEFSAPFHALPSSLQKLSLTFDNLSLRQDESTSRILSMLPNLVDFELRLPDFLRGSKGTITKLIEDITRNPNLGMRLQRITLIVDLVMIKNDLILMCIRFLEARNARSARTGNRISQLTHFCLVGTLPTSQPIENDLIMAGRLEALASRGTQFVIRHSLLSKQLFPVFPF